MLSIWTSQKTCWTSQKTCCLVKSESSPKRQILDISKLKEFADDNFKLDKNGRKFSKRVENTVGKGEIARNEQFLLFPQCFQKASKNQGLCGKGLKFTHNVLECFLAQLRLLKLRIV